MLQLQYFGHLMWTDDSLGTFLMLGKIENRRRGYQRMRRLDSIIDAMGMNLGRLQTVGKDREAWCAAVSRLQSRTWRTAEQQLWRQHHPPWFIGWPLCAAHLIFTAAPSGGGGKKAGEAGSVTQSGNKEASVQTWVWLSSGHLLQEAFCDLHTPSTMTPALYPGSCYAPATKADWNFLIYPSPSSKQLLDKFIQNKPDAKPGIFPLWPGTAAAQTLCSPLAQEPGELGGEPCERGNLLHIQIKYDVISTGAEFFLQRRSKDWEMEGRQGGHSLCRHPFCNLTLAGSSLHRGKGRMHPGSLSWKPEVWGVGETKAAQDRGPQPQRTEGAEKASF